MYCGRLMLAQIVVRAIRASARLGAVLAGNLFTTFRGNFTGLNSRYAFLTNNLKFGGQHTYLISRARVALSQTSGPLQLFLTA